MQPSGVMWTSTARLEGLLDLVSDSPWTYPALVGLVTFDAVLPILPGESSAVTAAVIASRGELVIWLVLGSVVLGGMAGDNLSYAIGRRFGRKAYFRLFRGEKHERRFDWVRGILETHTVWVIPALKFIPGGRTAVTMSCGAVEVRWKRFFLADMVAVTVWASVYTALGYFGGQLFRDSLWAALLVSLGFAALIWTVGYVWYRLRERRDRARALAGRAGDGPAERRERRRHG